MSTSKVTIKVPDELVTELIAAGFAEDTTARRSGNWELAANWLTATGTVISLLQGPETVTWLAKALLNRKKTKPQGQVHYLEARGEEGELRIPITDDTSFADIERLLTATIFPAKGSGK